MRKKIIFLCLVFGVFFSFSLVQADEFLSGERPSRPSRPSEPGLFSATETCWAYDEYGRKFVNAGPWTTTVRGERQTRAVDECRIKGNGECYKGGCHLHDSGPLIGLGEVNCSAVDNSGWVYSACGYIYPQDYEKTAMELCERGPNKLCQKLECVRRER